MNPVLGIKGVELQPSWQGSLEQVDQVDQVDLLQVDQVENVVPSAKSPHIQQSNAGRNDHTALGETIDLKHV